MDDDEAILVRHWFARSLERLELRRVDRRIETQDASEPPTPLDQAMDTVKEITYDECLAYMLETLCTMALPEVARAGLEVAERYVRGDASDEELGACQAACWRSIPEQRLGGSDRSATRATICALFPRSHNEWSLPDLCLSWFVGFAEEAGVSQTELIDRLHAMGLCVPPTS